MRKESYQALVSAELNIKGTYWTIEAIDTAGVHLLAGRNKNTLPLEEFMQEAQLDINSFDPDTIAQAEVKAQEPAGRKTEQLEGIREFQIYRTTSVYERRKPLDFPKYPEIRIDSAFDASCLQEFVALDTEATGLSAYEDRLIQLSAVRFVKGEAAEYYNTFLNPHKEMSYGAESLTGIRNEMLQNAPEFAEIADSFREFVGNSPLVGYYTYFDLQMLWCAGLDLVKDHTVFDAQWYVFKQIPKGYLKDRKLGTVAGYYGVEFPAHDSLGDSYATGKVFLKSVQEMLERR